MVNFLNIREIPFAVYGGNTLCPDKLKAMKKYISFTSKVKIILTDLWVDTYLLTSGNC
jgi:hypothetical protein